MEVFVVFADEVPFPGLQGSAVDRKILHVVDSVEKARQLVHKLNHRSGYEYVDFESFTLE